MLQKAICSDPHSLRGPTLSKFVPFDVSTMDAQEQAVRFGYGNDYIALFFLDDDRLLMVVNHESTAAGMMFEGGGMQRCALKASK